MLIREKGSVIYEEPGHYAAHPHLASLGGGGLALVFTRSRQRPYVLHPPLDPYFENIFLRSEDGGETWSPPAPVPGFGATGAECAGLTVLADGRLMLNQFRFTWMTIGQAAGLERKDTWAFPEDLARDANRAADMKGLSGATPYLPGHFPWVRGTGVTEIHVSDNRGDRWSGPIIPDLGRFAGGYGMRGGLVLADGTVLLPLSDPPRYETVFIIRSGDQGRTWSPPEAEIHVPGRFFEEPSILAFPSGRIVMLLRENTSRGMYSTRSVDGGRTWSPPEPCGLEGLYPADLDLLDDGRAICVTARRGEGAGVFAHVSEDQGRTWRPALDVDVLPPTHDLGYPSLARVDEGTYMAVYYKRGTSGLTGIHGVRIKVA